MWQEKEKMTLLTCYLLLLGSLPKASGSCNKLPCDMPMWQLVTSHQGKTPTVGMLRFPWHIQKMSDCESRCSSLIAQTNLKCLSAPKLCILHVRSIKECPSQGLTGKSKHFFFPLGISGWFKTFEQKNHSLALTLRPSALCPAVAQHHSSCDNLALGKASLCFPETCLVLPLGQRDSQMWPQLTQGLPLVQNEPNTLVLEGNKSWPFKKLQGQTELSSTLGSALASCVARGGAYPLWA